MSQEISGVPFESASEGKISEYLERFKKGALTVDELSPESLGAFYPTVRDRLIRQIPPKYFNDKFPPPLLGQMWTQAIPVDAEKAEAQARIRTLALRAYELRWTDRHKDENEIETVTLPVEDTQTVPAPENVPPHSIPPESVEENPIEHAEEGIIRNETEARVAARALELSKDKPQAVKDLWEKLLVDQLDPQTRDTLTKAIFDGTYNELRVADYPIDRTEESTWEYARNKRGISVRTENDWMYRGVFNVPNGKTETRGSFNVNVTPALIDALDELVTTGGLQANYKFGKPGTKASPVERHDAITIYFFEQPNQEVLTKLSTIITPYVRGNTLLGEKVAEGFSLSEIGSIKTEQIVKLVDLFDSLDPSFAAALKTYATPQGGGVLAISEAQFYAVQRTAADFGYSITYNNKDGFDLQLEPLSGDVETAVVPTEETPMEPDTAFDTEVVVPPSTELPEKVSESGVTNNSEAAATLEKVPEAIHPSRFESKSTSSIHERALREGSQLRRTVVDLGELLRSRNSHGNTNFMPRYNLDLLLNGSESLIRALQSNETTAIAKSIDEIIHGLEKFGKNIEPSTNDTPQSIDRVGYSLEDVKRSLRALQDVYDSDRSPELTRLKNDLARGISMIRQHQDLVQRLSTALRRLQN